MQFNPTPVQLKAAQKLIIAYALRTLARTDIHHVSKQILSENTFQYDADYCLEELQSINQSTDTDFTVQNPDHVHMISGFFEKNQPGIETEAKKFDMLLNNHLIEIGFTDGNHIIEKANTDILALENTFLRSTKNVHHNKSLLFDNADTRLHQIDTLLQYFYCQDWSHHFLRNEATCFNHYNTLHATRKFSYAPDEYSLNKCRAYKRRITIDNYLTGQNRITHLHLFEHVACVWGYLPGCFIFEIQPGKRWQYGIKLFSTKRYVVVTYRKEFFEDDNIQALEYRLLNGYIASNIL